MLRWISISGVVRAGYGVASGAGSAEFPEGSVRMQLPHFAERGLDLSDLHPATLNVDISPHSFALPRPEFTFPSVKWSPEHPAEDFSFSPCRVATAGEVFGGYVYYPHPATKPAHRHPSSVVEVLAPYIPEIEYGRRVVLELARGEVSVT